MLVSVPIHKTIGNITPRVVGCLFTAHSHTRQYFIHSTLTHKNNEDTNHPDHQKHPILHTHLFGIPNSIYIYVWFDVYFNYDSSFHTHHCIGMIIKHKQNVKVRMISFIIFKHWSVYYTQCCYIIGSTMEVLVHYVQCCYIIGSAMEMLFYYTS